MAEVCVCSGVFHYELRWKIVCFIYCIIYVIVFLLRRLLCAHTVIDYDLDVCIHTPHVCPRAHGCLHAYIHIGVKCMYHNICINYVPPKQDVQLIQSHFSLITEGVSPG